MNQKTDYYLQTLTSIGMPLMRGVLQHSADKNAADVAQAVAGLLTKSVQAGIALGPLVDLDQQGEKADGVRVALAGLVSVMLGQYYQDNGAAPSDADLNHMAEGLKAVIGFAENFQPSEESVLRLQAIDDTQMQVDIPQSHIQYLRGFVDVVQAVHGFSFGVPASQLAGQVAQRLAQKASALRSDHYGDQGSTESQKAQERSFIAVLASVYAGCHRAVVQNLEQAGPEQSAPSIDQVWSLFEEQFQILEVLMSTLAGVENISGSASNGGVSPSAESSVPAAPEAVPPAQVPVPPLPPGQPLEGASSLSPAQGGVPQKPAIFAAKKPEAPPEQAPAAASPISPVTPPPAPAQDPSSAPANPMGFFAKKPDEDSSVSSASADASPVTPSPLTPPAAPIVPPPEQENSAGAQGGDKPPAAPGGNPMSFFTKKDDEE